MAEQTTPVETVVDAATPPATAGADMRSDESLELNAAAVLLALMSVSGKTEEDESENAKQTEDPDHWKPCPPPEDCPVCMVPLPMRNDGSAYFPCCGKTICSACEEESTRAHNIINSKRAKKELPPLKECCAFCRLPYCDDEEHVKRCLLRMEKDDCEAYFNMASYYHRGGTDGLPRDESKALELLLRAAELGSTRSMAFLGDVYARGTLGAKIDTGKSREFFERAAKRGNFPARISLGQMEIENNNHDLAIRHWQLAAEGGVPLGMKLVWRNFYRGKLSKGELENTLRAHHNAIEERKSEDRERYTSFQKAMKGDNKVLTTLYHQYYDGGMTAKELNTAVKIYKSMSSA